MNGIIVNESNIKIVYGRLIKFFKPNGKYKTTSMIYDLWADTKCRRNNHVKPNNKVNVCITKCMAYVDDNEIIKVIEISGYTLIGGDPRIIYIKCGNKIAFCGNRIVFEIDMVYDNEIIKAYIVIQVCNNISQDDFNKLYEGFDNSIIEKKCNDNGYMTYNKCSNGTEEWYDYDNGGHVTHYKDSDEFEIWNEYNEDGDVLHSKNSNGYEKWY